MILQAGKRLTWGADGLDSWPGAPEILEATIELNALCSEVGGAKRCTLPCSAVIMLTASSQPSLDCPRSPAIGGCGYPGASNQGGCTDSSIRLSLGPISRKDMTDCKTPHPQDVLFLCISLSTHGQWSGPWKVLFVHWSTPQPLSS